MIKVLKSVVVGPLEPYAAGFAAELERQGYTAWTVEKQVGLAAHLSRWMAAAGVESGDLTAQVAERYVSARRAAGYASYRSAHALEPLLGYLRGLGVAPAAEALPVTPAQELLERFQRYLVSERGIGAATAEGYACFVRPFITARLGPGGPGLEDLAAADVTAFVVASCPGKPATTRSSPARLAPVLPAQRPRQAALLRQVLLPGRSGGRQGKLFLEIHDEVHGNGSGAFTCRIRQYSWPSDHRQKAADRGRRPRPVKYSRPEPQARVGGRAARERAAGRCYQPAGVDRLVRRGIDSLPPHRCQSPDGGRRIRQGSNIASSPATAEDPGSRTRTGQPSPRN